MTRPVQIEFWADVMCPWCWIGKRRLDSAVARLGRPVDVVWRSFELRPGHPAVPGPTLRDMMAVRYGLDADRLGELFGRIEELGAAEGLLLRPATARPVNSFDAHRLIRAAAEHGLADAMAERLFAAHLTDNADVADRTVLTGLARDAGLDAGAVRAVLDGTEHAGAVLADRRRAGHAGIRQVPTFVVDGVPAAAGAESTAVLLDRLRGAAGR
ncbi:DsbA family protein [Streptomyces luteireticuli]|uniref:DsbA family oxidoreductase n=1 Tax=Streptomyces luteireticuli TaxID=173858 RepID=UPI003556174C